ncbi:MAG: hypothetical protein P8Z49_08495 [Acidobacteriota bacterium]
MNAGRVPLAKQRCLNHPARDAAVKCPGCGSFFCRECTVEHEGRFLCAACVEKNHPAKARGEGRWKAVLFKGMLLVFALLLSCLFFYWVGGAVIQLSTPSAFMAGGFP